MFMETNKEKTNIWINIQEASDVLDFYINCYEFLFIFVNEVCKI